MGFLFLAGVFVFSVSQASIAGPAAVEVALVLRDMMIDAGKKVIEEKGYLESYSAKLGAKNSGTSMRIPSYYYPEIRLSLSYNAVEYDRHTGIQVLSGKRSIVGSPRKSGFEIAEADGPSEFVIKSLGDLYQQAGKPAMKNYNATLYPCVGYGYAERNVMCAAGLSLEQLKDKKTVTVKMTHPKTNESFTLEVSAK